MRHSRGAGSTNPFTYLRAYVRITRFEYLPGELPGLMVPLFLAASSARDLFSPYVLEGVLVFGLLYLSGFIVNSLTDVDVDRKYKSYISDGVGVLGRRAMIGLLLAHLLIPLGLSLHLAYALNEPVLIPLVLVGIFCGMAYSLKPFQFKVKGVLSFISLGLSAFFIPGVFLYTVVSGWPSVPLVIAFFGFMVLAYGIELGNQAGDWLEDRACGLNTPPVKWGLSRSLAVGLVMFLAGFAVLTAGLFWHVARMETSLSIAFPLALVLIPLILVAGYAVPLKGMVDLYRISTSERGGGGPERDLRVDKRIKARLKYPWWQASGLYGFLLVAMLLFSASAFYGADEPPYPPGGGAPDYSGVHISDVRLSHGIDAFGRVEVEVLVSANGTHSLDELGLTCVSVLGKEVLENRTCTLSEIRTTVPGSDGVRASVELRAHEINDTALEFRLFHRSASGHVNGLDTWSVPPRDELFITNTTYRLQPGLVKDTLYIDVTVYNRLDPRAAGALSVTASGSLQLLPVEVDNNRTVAPDSYWHAPTLKLEVPKTPGTFEVELHYNGVVRDLAKVTTS